MSKIQISKDELQKIYDEMTVNEALISLDVSLVTFYRLLDSAGIKRKRSRTEKTSYEVV